MKGIEGAFKNALGAYMSHLTFQSQRGVLKTPDAAPSVPCFGPGTRGSARPFGTDSVHAEWIA